MALRDGVFGAFDAGCWMPGLRFAAARSASMGGVMTKKVAPRSECKSEVRVGLPHRSAEVVAQVADQVRAEVMSPLQIGIDASGVAGIDEAEKIRTGGVAILPAEAAGNLVLGIDGVADAGIDVALIADADQRRLIVVARTARKVRQGIKIQKCRLRRTGSDFIALGFSRHQSCRDARVPVARELVVDEEECVVAAQDLRNFQRTAKRSVGAEMGISQLGPLLTGQRIRFRIERGVVQHEGKVSVVLPATPASVSKG